MWALIVGALTGVGSLALKAGTAVIQNPALVQFLKQLALITLVVGGLTYLTNSFVIKEMIPYLTTFFVVIRSVIMPFDFFVDTKTLFTLLSLVISFQIGIWIFRAYISVTHFFNER